MEDNLMFSYEHKVCKDNRRLMSVKEGKVDEDEDWREKTECIMAIGKRCS